jgi:hypothetical protein
MPGIYYRTFGGMIPAINSLLLPDTAAQTALNIDFSRGDLRALMQPADVIASDILAKVGVKKSLYRFGQDRPTDQDYWFHWTADVDVARGPIADDTEERTYYCGDVKPRKTTAALALTGGGTSYPIAYYDMGVPAPSSALSLVSVTGTATGTPEDRLYTFTHVGVIGADWDESAPARNATTGADLSLLVPGVYEGQTVNLTIPATPTNSSNIQYKNVYRSVNGALILVETIASSTTTLADTYASDVVAGNVLLPSSGWDEPPDDLKGLMVLAFGSLAGFHGQEWCVTPPYQMHTFPVGFRQTLDYPIVAHGTWGNVVAVLTKGRPYLISGSDPASMSVEKLQLDQACVSKRSIANTGIGLIYASPDGLAYVGADGYRLMTQGIVTREQWQSYKPETITGFWHEGRYFGFYDTGSVQAGFMFDTQSPTPFSLLSTFAPGGYVDPRNDGLYLVNSNRVQRWRASVTPLSYTWLGKLFRMPVPCNMVWAQVVAESYVNLTLKLYADGALVATKTVLNRKPFKMPAGYLATDFALELTGTDTVTFAGVSTTLDDFKQV